MRYRITSQLELWLDTEYRRQEDNALRSRDDTTFLASAAVEWSGAAPEGFAIAHVADNLPDSEFQPFFGTPACGRQYSLNVPYAWRVISGELQ